MVSVLFIHCNGRDLALGVPRLLGLKEDHLTWPPRGAIDFSHDQELAKNVTAVIINRQECLPVPWLQWAKVWQFLDIAQMVSSDVLDDDADSII